MEKIIKIYRSKTFDSAINLNLDIFLVYVILNIYILLSINSEFHSLESSILLIKSIQIIAANTLLVASIYLLNKISDEKEDEINKSALYWNKTEYLLKFYGLANVISFILYFYTYKKFMIVWLIFFILGLLYSYPKTIRLKKVFLLKNTIPALCWYVSICLLFQVNLPYTNFSEILFENISFLFMFLCFEIIWDLPDITGDRAAKVKTLPTVFGFNNTKKLVLCANFILFLTTTYLKMKITLFLISFILIFLNEKSSKKDFHLITISVTFLYIIYSVVLLTFGK